MTTRWWWLRHAPSVGAKGHLIGRTDVPAELDPARIAALARLLPSNALLLVSPLRRCLETADALVASGLHPSAMRIEPALAEQDFGNWDGRAYAELEANEPERYGRLMADPVHVRPPGGESFYDVCARIGALQDAPPAASDIVAVAHAGTIRAALTRARGLEPQAALLLEIAPLSLHSIETEP